MPESTFYMLRCVVAIACADKVVKHEELIFLRNLLSHFKRHMYVTPDQVAQLKADLKNFQPIEVLLPHVTEKGDREQLILFAGLLAQADGDVHPAEEDLIRRIQEYVTAHQNDAGPAIEPPSKPAQASVIPAVPFPANSVPAPAGGVTNADMKAFMQEVHDVIKQEVYQQALKTSGVGPGTGPVAVVDAFAEKSKVVPHTDSYDIMVEESKLGKDMRHSLVPDERLLARAHFHWIYSVYSLLGAGLLIGASWPVGRFLTTFAQGFQAYLLSPDNAFFSASTVPDLYKAVGNPLVHLVPQYGLLLVALLFVAWRAAIQFTTEIVVTDSRLVVKQGIFHIKTFKSDLTTLGQVDVDQSLLGHILGFGSIHIYTRNWSGKGDQVEAEGINLPPISDPHSFSTQIDRARRMWRKGQV